jgi:predicted nucleotidyltransferase
MGEATREQFVKTFRRTLQVLDDVGAESLLIGGLATEMYLEQDWDRAEDIDLLIRERAADALLTAFADAGFAVERYDQRWLFKVARPNVTVDLMFRAGEHIPLDDEHLSRAVDATFEGVPVRIPSVADLIVMKAIFDSVERPKNWHKCVHLIAHGSLDWDYFVERAHKHAPARMLSLLLYARTDGIDVPAAALSRLAAPALGESTAHR